MPDSVAVIAVLLTAVVIGSAATALPASITDVRLAGGPSPQLGMLQVQGSDGQWWPALELCIPSPRGSSGSGVVLAETEAAVAQVACRQLGYSGGRPLGEYLPGMVESVQGPALSAMLLCSGKEASVEQCDLVESECADGWAPEDDPLAPGPRVERTMVAVACDDGDEAIQAVRLVGGGSSQEGRLELQVGGLWGSVCSAARLPLSTNGGGDAAETEQAHLPAAEAEAQLAEAACRQLNLTGGAARVGPFYGGTSAPVLLGRVVCTGDEQELSECTVGTGTPCAEEDLLGVACDGAPTITALRLVNGATARQGRLEVQISGLWGTVSSQGTTAAAAAAVACRHLGWATEGAEPRGSSFYGDGPLPALLLGAVCTGSEASLSECHLTWNPRPMDHSDAFGVACAAERAVVGLG